MPISQNEMLVRLNEDRHLKNDRCLEKVDRALANANILTGHKWNAACLNKSRREDFYD